MRVVIDPNVLVSAAEHDPSWGRVWHLVAHTGMRRSEVARLRWRGGDLEVATVTVARAKTVRGRRTIDVDPGTVVVLRELRAQQRRDRLSAGPAWREHGTAAAFAALVAGGR